MISNFLIRRALLRAPDFIVGGKADPYLLRWWIVPRNPLFNVYLHQFLRSDDDRAHHDHPWLFNLSWLVRGSYIEHTISAGGVVIRTQRNAGAWKFRWGRAPHRLELMHDCDFDTPVSCWTMFVTGPRIREWGFYCMERGWVHWKAFTAASDKGAVGRGCDQ